MSANFLNESGVMAGVDDHKFFTAVPPPMLELLVPHFPYFASVLFDWPATFYWNRKDTITADARRMVDIDFALFLVPHLTAAFGGPSQPANLAMTISTSGSEVSLGIGSVTGKGDPLAACIHEAVGWNLNCWESGDHPSGSVLCVCSVQTTPSGLDYALAAIKWLVAGFIAEKYGKSGGERIGKIIKRIPQAVFEVLIKQAIINAVEQLVVLVRDVARRLGF